GRTPVGREGPQTLPADDGPLRGQGPDGLPDRHARDTVPGGELGFGGQPLAGGPFTSIESHPQVIADADVYWPVHCVTPGLPTCGRTGCRASHLLRKMPSLYQRANRSPGPERDAAPADRPG